MKINSQLVLVFTYYFMNFVFRLFPRKTKPKPPHHYPTNFGQALNVSCSYCAVTTTFNTYMRIRFGDIHRDNPEFQCQQCGQLQRVLYSKGMDMDNPGKACACSGQLSRTKQLVCPHCKNTKT